MIIIFVEHYLTKQGKEIFPKWIKDVNKSLKKYKGFNYISQLKDLNKNNRTLLILEFESQNLLKLWTTSDDHNLKIEELEEFMIDKPKSQILTFDKH